MKLMSMPSVVAFWLFVVSTVAACEEPYEDDELAYAAGTPQYFGYWNTGGAQGPGFWETTNANRGYVNVTMNLDLHFLHLAQQTGQKAVISWPFWGYVDVDAAGNLIDNSPPGWWEDFVASVEPYRGIVAAVSITDEPDCNYAGATFPSGWTPENCRRMRAKIEKNIEKLKSRFPEIPAWVNYTSAYAAGVVSPGAGWGYELPYNADWVSFDCYTPFEHCWGNASVADLVVGLEQKLRPGQRIALIPQANQNNWAGSNPPLSQNQIAAMADQYYQLALSHPSIVGIFPFIWWSLNDGKWLGAGDAPVVREKWRSIGQAIVGSSAPFDGNWGPFSFGIAGDVPLVSKMTNPWTGDAPGFPIVFRPSSGMWYVDTAGFTAATEATTASFQFGLPGDIPFVSKLYNVGWCASVECPIIYRPSTATWYVNGLGVNGLFGSYTGDTAPIQFGLGGDMPVIVPTANGNCIGVYRPSDGHTYVNTNNGRWGEGITWTTWY